MDVAGPSCVWTSGVGVTQLKPARMLEQQNEIFYLLLGGGRIGESGVFSIV